LLRHARFPGGKTLPFYLDGFRKSNEFAERARIHRQERSPRADSPQRHRAHEAKKRQGKLGFLIWGTRLTVSPPCTAVQRFGAPKGFIVVLRHDSVPEPPSAFAVQHALHRLDANSNLFRTSCSLCLCGKSHSATSAPFVRGHRGTDSPQRHREHEAKKRQGKLGFLIWGTRLTVSPPCTAVQRFGALKGFIVVLRHDSVPELPSAFAVQHALHRLDANSNLFRT